MGPHTVRSFSSPKSHRLSWAWRQGRLAPQPWTCNYQLDWEGSLSNSVNLPKEAMTQQLNLAMSLTTYSPYVSGSICLFGLWAEQLWTDSLFGFNEAGTSRLFWHLLAMLWSQLYSWPLIILTIFRANCQCTLLVYASYVFNLFSVAISIYTWSGFSFFGFFKRDVLIILSTIKLRLVIKLHNTPGGKRWCAIAMGLLLMSIRLLFEFWIKTSLQPFES